MPRRERPTPLPALVFTLKVVVPAPGHGTRNFRSYYVPRPSTTQLASLAARAETRSNRVVILLGAWVLAGSTIIRNSVVTIITIWCTTRPARAVRVRKPKTALRTSGEAIAAPAIRKYYVLRRDPYFPYEVIKIILILAVSTSMRFECRMTFEWHSFDLLLRPAFEAQLAHRPVHRTKLSGAVTICIIGVAVPRRV